MRSYLLAATAAALLFSVAPAAPAASLTHSYNLNGSYADSLGGPSLVPNGGTLGTDTYDFPANDGLSLSNALAGYTDDYSIELMFHFDTISGYRKIIDFKDRSADAGLYNQNGYLNFYPVASSSTPVIAQGSDVHVVLTRNGATGQTVGYVNGVQQLSFTDSSSLATFSASNNVIQFFRDDTFQNSEASAGSVDFIRIYRGALSSGEVASLSSADLPAAVPAPAAAWAGMVLLPALALFNRRRQRALA